LGEHGNSPLLRFEALTLTVPGSQKQFKFLHRNEADQALFVIDKIALYHPRETPMSHWAYSEKA
jgi:hypothetical protein